MTSREKFEAWAKDNGMSLVYGDCDYVYSPTVWAWKAWQAAEADMAVQLANAESKFRELAAENAALKAASSCLVSEYMMNKGDDNEFIACITPSKKTIGTGGVWDMWRHLDMALDTTPATEAVMAEARAQGVEMFADDLLCPDLDSTIREFAAQLRQGAAL